MKTIILLSGKKGAGKDTSYNLIKSLFKCNNCKEKYIICGEFLDYSDTTPKCSSCYGGYQKKIRKMSFADPLKSICINALGLTNRQCYGESVERETNSDIRWSDISSEYQRFKKENSGDFLTAREILQLVGTDVMRNFFPNIWAKAATISALRATDDIVVFTDTRFPNEIEEFEKLEEDGKISLITVRLVRDTGFKDSHSSELALDSWDSSGRFKKVIFNNGTFGELKSMLANILKEEGILDA